MSEIILSDTNSPSPHNNSREMTFQEYQSVYSELTKKTENLERKYQKTFQLNKTHLAHLHDVLKDTFSQYSIIDLNTNLVVYQSDKTKKQYSSIEHFLKVSTLTKAIENIDLEFNLLIQLPNIQQKQNYKISISLVSDLIAFENIRMNIPVEFADLIEKNNISIKIDYVDYIIAKSILHSFDGWVDDISLRDSKLITFLSGWRNSIATSVRYSIVLISLLLIYFKVPAYISVQNPNMQILVKYLLMSAILFYIADKTGLFLRNFIVRNLAYLQNFSTIVLTPEDEKNLADYQRKTIYRIISIFTTVALTIIYGVISSVIASKYFGAN